MDYKKFEVNRDKVVKSSRKINANHTISNYYKELSEECGTLVKKGVKYNNEKFETKAKMVKLCYKYWDSSYYRILNVKDIKRINLCHDKFCKNCQNVLSNLRYNHFKPMLDKLAEKYKVYHIVFSLPNMSGIFLKESLDKMYAKFPYFIQYLQGKRKIKNLNLEKYGFIGAIKSLEVTVHKNAGSLEYHPHFHCVFVFEKGLAVKKEFINDFTFDRFHRKKDRKFTVDEILFQKIWFLLMNNKKVTLKAIEDLKQGYSLTADYVKNGDKKSLKEVFKYTLKDTFGDVLNSYDIFKTLYFALKSRRIIQGYGKFFRINFEVDYDKLDEEVDEEYFSLLRELNQFDSPIDIIETIDEVVSALGQENNQITYISKSKIRKVVYERNNS